MPSILGKRLLFITAHPDDESYLVAGTINENHKAGGKTFVLCATLGERGKAHVPSSTSAAQLKKIRKTELAAASDTVRLDELVLGNLPDGELQACTDKLLDTATRCIKKFKPDSVVSFAQDGITAHRDHIAAGEVAKKLAQTFTIPFVAICAPPALIKNADVIKKRRSHGVYKNDIIYQQHNFKIKIDPKVKMRALLCHASQMPINNPFHSIPPKAAKQMLAYEYFYIET